MSSIPAIDGDAVGTARRDEQFSTALRAAIENRGLTLERLRAHLNRRGHEISIATLSYWQSGRSRPERAASLAALTALEDILRVPEGELTSKLAPRRRRTPPNPSDPSSVTPILEVWPQVVKLSEAIGVNWDDGFDYVSVHDMIQVGENRRVQKHMVRQTLRASRDGIDSIPVLLWGDGRGCGSPYITPRLNCKLGKTAAMEDRALVVAQLISVPLRKGDPVVVDYEFGFEDEVEPMTIWRRLCLKRTRDVHIEVSFHEKALPRAAELYRRTEDEEYVEPLIIVGSTLRCLDLDFGPGVTGLRWEW